MPGAAGTAVDPAMATRRVGLPIPAAETSEILGDHEYHHRHQESVMQRFMKFYE